MNAMSAPSNDSGSLLTLCPKSLDPWSLEPLRSCVYLKPMIERESIPLSEAKAPISFPELSLPFVLFDTHVPRDFDTGEVVDGDIGCHCSGDFLQIDTIASNQGHSSMVDSIVADVFQFLGTDYDFEDGRNLLKDHIEECPSVTADAVAEEYLELKWTELPVTGSKPKESLEGSEVNEVEDMQKLLSNLDPEIQATLEKRMRQPTNEVKNCAILEDCTEKLGALRELVPEPAFEWPFELDTFQKQAILCLERNQSVLVAAHTSAGKTVVAEYAAALCRRHGSRAIYTSPIKALSNQKFRDFRQTFGEDVGLLTGDIKVATKSSILVMTTEILHNMLCNDADTIRDLEIVIMDEVHYMNDKERGHVWEQLMILLPQHVLLVLLSATLPNALEFADWLGRIRGGTTIHVCQTHRRPVPLEHYLYTGCDTATRENVYLVVDKDGRFCREGYREAQDSLIKPKKVGKKSSETVTNIEALDKGERERNSAKKKPRSKFSGGKGNTPGRHNYLQKGSEEYNRSEKSNTTIWVGLIRMLSEHELMPVIVFCFSRAKINHLVQCLDSVDLLDKSEKNEVMVFLRAAIGSRLKGSDKLLDQVLLVRKLAVRGIAIHHAGMLPLLKEAVEMLFQRGLVRILFATETFAMGVNMPARCVVFTSTQKHDGSKRRPLTAGEYTQMAGRAGRRGLDPTGTVIIMANNCDISPMPTDLQLQQVILGQATRLASRFKITYSMILYLHRGNLQTPQELIRQSFMHAGDLRYELMWRRQRDWLRQLTNDAAAGSSSSRRRRPMSKWGPVVTVVPAEGEAEGWKSVQCEVRCPAHQPLQSEEAAKALCVDSVVGYYDACCRWRELSYALSEAAAKVLSLPALTKVFAPGRLVQLQLAPEAMRSAAQSMSGGRLTPNLGPKYVPNWITLGVVLEVTKSSSRLSLSVVTWELPKSPISDCSTKIGDTPEEEDVLVDGESALSALTPFPPHLMSKYSPESLEESKQRLLVLTEVPLTSLLSVSSTRVAGIDEKTFASSLHRDLTLFRQQRQASAEGLCVVVHKKHGEGSQRSQTSPLDATNEALFYGDVDPLPFWQHMGLEGPQVEQWTELIHRLSRGHDELVPRDCGDLVGHLSLMHHVTRRRWAVGRLTAKLGRNQGGLLEDYHARVRVLEELGFLDKDTQSGCLTRKGRAACELQQMEVLLAEVLFDGSIIELPPADIAALLSCFVCESGSSGANANYNLGPPGGSGGAPQSSTPAAKVALVSRAEMEAAGAPPALEDLYPLPSAVPDHLQPFVRNMLAKADQLQGLQVELGVQDTEADVRLSPALVGASWAWASGQSFGAAVAAAVASAAEMGTGGAEEGHVVRALQRLDELLRHVGAAFRGLGDCVLSERLLAAHRAVHRDLVCAPSLYVAEQLESSASDKETAEPPVEN